MGQLEEIQKKRTRRAVKFQRAITGQSLADIMAKRNQKSEVREVTTRADKEAKTAKQDLKRKQWLSLWLPQRQLLSKTVKVSAP